MRHKVRSRTLGRQTGHRLLMLRNMATSLLRHERIETTLCRAREVSRFTDSIITLARKARMAATPAQALAYKRRVFSLLLDKKDKNEREVAQILFESQAQRYIDRHNDTTKPSCGGYTRVLHTGVRKGDGAPMAIVELV